MNDTLDKDTHEPKDPSGYYNLANRVARLESLTEMYGVGDEELENLEHSIKALEDRVEADGIAINQLFTRMIVLEGSLAKQRAVNEAFLAWFAALSEEERDGFAEPLAAAIREALK